MGLIINLMSKKFKSNSGAKWHWAKERDLSEEEDGIQEEEEDDVLQEFRELLERLFKECQKLNLELQHIQTLMTHKPAGYISHCSQ